MRRLLAFVMMTTTFLTLSLVAQTNKGSISGTVFDSSGGVLPSALVTITNLGTGHKVVLETSDQGTYIAPNLDPVEYRSDV